MMKVLDYYYLVLLRWYDNMFKKDRLSYRVTGIVAFTFVINLISLIILFNYHILDYIIFWISYVISGWVIYAILDIIYNKKRRERLREQYKEESDESRQRGVILIVLYEIGSVTFLILTILYQTF